MKKWEQRKLLPRLPDKGHINTGRLKPLYHISVYSLNILGCMLVTEFEIFQVSLFLACMTKINSPTFFFCHHPTAFQHSPPVSLDHPFFAVCFQECSNYFARWM